MQELSTIDFMLFPELKSNDSQEIHFKKWNEHEIQDLRVSVLRRWKIHGSPLAPALAPKRKWKEKLGKIFYALKFNLEIYLSCDKNYNVGIILIPLARGRRKPKKPQYYNNARTYLHWIIYFAAYRQAKEGRKMSEFSFISAVIRNKPKLGKHKKRRSKNVLGNWRKCMA